MDLNSNALTYIGNVPVALLDACESASCPCKHAAIDHAWHGCEECGCKRSGIHALLASGAVTVSRTGQQCWCPNRHDGHRHDFVPGHGAGLCGNAPTALLGRSVPPASETDYPCFCRTVPNIGGGACSKPGCPLAHALDTKARPAACSCGGAKYAGSPTFVRERHAEHLADVALLHSSASPYVELAEEHLDEAERDDSECTTPPGQTS